MIWPIKKKPSLQTTIGCAAIHRLRRHDVPRNDVESAESGSVIIWILIAVGLMAALTYAFMGSSRTSTTMLTDAQAEAYANEIIAYGNEVKSAVKRLRLRGCADTEISFENNVVPGYTNPNAPADKSCHVFDIAGGGLTWKTLKIGTISEFGFYTNATNNNPAAGFGSSKGDVWLRANERVDLNPHSELLKICPIINKIANVPPNTSGYLNYYFEFYNAAAIAPFTGSFEDSKSGLIYNAETAEKNFFCATSSGNRIDFLAPIIKR